MLMSSDFAHEVVIHSTLKSFYKRLLTFIAWAFDILFIHGLYSLLLYSEKPQVFRGFAN